MLALESQCLKEVLGGYMLPVSLVLRTIVTWVDLKDRIGDSVCTSVQTLLHMASATILLQRQQNNPISSCWTILCWDQFSNTTH